MLLPRGNDGPIRLLVAAASSLFVGFHRDSVWADGDFGDFNKEFKLTRLNGINTKGIYTNPSTGRLDFIIDQNQTEFSNFTSLTIGADTYLLADAALNTSGIYGQAQWSGATLLTAGLTCEVRLD